MKLQIIGDGAFGSFLKELLKPHFNISFEADHVILAVPFSAYEEVASKNRRKHLINVCSVQKPSTDICLKYSDRITSIHPLFGRRTPAAHRHSILTYRSVDNDTWDSGKEFDGEFLTRFANVSQIYDKAFFGSTTGNMQTITPERHDQIMAKTHLAAVMAAQQLRVYVERARDIPDHLIPNSFRLMRDFVKTLDDMPPGTVDSIMANPYL